MQITPLQRVERLARRQNEARSAEALRRARETVEKAKRDLRLTVCTAADAINAELDHVPNAQAVARAVILSNDLESTIKTMEQYLDDLLFQPMQLLSREANEQ